MFTTKNTIHFLLLSVMGQSVTSADAARFDEFHRMMAVTYLNACNSLSGDDQCCVGSQVCKYLEPGITTIDKGSCRDLFACRRVSLNGIAVIGNNSCKGSYACENENGGKPDYIIGNGSCQGGSACKNNSYQDVTGRIGDGSCNERNACQTSVYLTSPHSFVIGNNSCNFAAACACLQDGDIVPHNSCNSVGQDQCCINHNTRGDLDLSNPLPSAPASTNAPTEAPTTAPTTAPTNAPTVAPTNAPTDAPLTDPGASGDPIIMGLNQQLFKFEGRDTAWYANVANEHLFWNMQFRQFDTCPLDENMFITAMSLSTSDHGDESDILIVATPEPIEGCRVDPNTVCLGEGTLHISFDGGNTFVSQPGDYHYGSRGRVVAHNTYAACSRKWQDYDVSEQEGRNLREGGRRTTVVEKKPLALLIDKKMKMIDAEECGTWIDDRVNNNDLFQQKGHWSTLHIDTGVASFHVEYRRSDWFNRRCDFQSLDAWMTKVDSKMEKVEWNGILGETKKKIYDASTGEQVLSDRMKLLRGKDDADYEVDGPFGKIFAAGAGLGAMATSTS